MDKMKLGIIVLLGLLLALAPFALAAKGGNSATNSTCSEKSAAVVLKTMPNPISNKVNMLIKLIARMEGQVNASSSIAPAEKHSILGELDVVAARAEAIKQKADALTAEGSKKSDLVKEYKPVLRDLQQLLRNIRKQSSTAPISYNENMTQAQKCPDNYGLAANSILLYYTDEPHSKAMLPIVAELEGSGYFFYKTNDLWNQKAGRCFDLVGSTPTFVCAGSKQKLVGEVSKETLQEFARNCTA